MRLRVGAILVTILAVAAAPTFAQSNVTGGVKIGVNFSKLTFTEEDVEDDETTDSRTGLVIGGFVDVPITELFSFQPEILYAQKGGKQEIPGLGDSKFKLDQIQIPLLFKASFAGTSVRPFVVAGPGFGFVTSAKIDEPDLDEDIDVKDDIASVEITGIIGAGLQFGRGIVEFRYDHGFTDLDDEDDFSEAKSKTWSILFGFGF